MSYDSPASQSTVSLEDLESFLDRNTRPILEPLLRGQTQTTAPFTAGSGVPAESLPESHVEGGPVPSSPSPTPMDPEDTDDGDEDVEEEGDEEIPESEPSESTPPAADDDELIEVSPGVHMTRTAIQQALAQRPPAVEPAPVVTEPVAGSIPVDAASAPATAPSPSIPQELLDDPDLGPFARVLQSQQQELDQTRQQLAMVSDIAVTRAQEELQARVTAGIHEFRDSHSLTEDQIIEINRVAANLNVMPSLASGIDPITGESIERDPQRAAYRALEIAMWSMPQYREQELASKVTARAKDQRKKQKLAGVSGGSGSVPRTTQIPTDRRSRELAAVSELREIMSPGSEE